MSICHSSCGVLRSKRCGAGPWRPSPAARGVPGCGASRAGRHIQVSTRAAGARAASARTLGGVCRLAAAWRV